MSDLRPTPETDAEIARVHAVLSAACKSGEWDAPVCALGVDFARNLERERDSAKTLNRSLLDQLEAKDAQIQMMIEHDKQRLESDSIVGSCDCLTKTPEVKYHKPGCKYRLVSERDKARERAESKHGLWMAELKRVTALENQLEAMREAIKEAHERYSKSAISHAAQLMCPECLRIESFDEEHKDSCSIGSALAKLQPFLKP